jgi:hypothetical protein
VVIVIIDPNSTACDRLSARTPQIQPNCVCRVCKRASNAQDAVREENRWKDGTTAVVALLLDAHLFLANLGDSESNTASTVDDMGLIFTRRSIGGE